MIYIKKIIIIFLQKSTSLSALACRLVQWTHKHSEPIHPKHLIQVRPPWYLSYLKENFYVLDIGCNNGQHTVRIAKKCKVVYGIDKDSKMLDMAHREVKRNRVMNVILDQVDIEKGLPYKNKLFDAILFLDVFEHLTKRNFILKEIIRVLKPNGLFLISVPNSETSWKQLQRKCGLFYYSDPDHKIEFTKKQIKILLRNSGFKIDSIDPVVYDTPLVGFIDLLGGISLTLYKLLIIWRRTQVLKNPENSIGFEIACYKK